MLLMGDYCNRAALGTSLESQAGSSTVAADDPGKRDVKAFRSPTSPTLSLNQDLHEEGCLGNLFPDETCFRYKCPYLVSVSRSIRVSSNP